MKRSFNIAIGVVMVFAPLAFTRAATLVVTSSSIILDTQGAWINAIEATLSFDPSEFRIDSVSDGSSVVNFWVSPPSYDNEKGTLAFTGVIPGGIQTSQGVIASFSLKGKKEGPSKGFAIVSARALLNDGQGTPAALTVISDPFILRAASSTPSLPDRQPPDLFLPEIVKNPSLFDGRYALVFAATDQGSGIDHYEVLETAKGNWLTATSPYLLQDQSLGGDVYVRAVDRAGNFRVTKANIGQMPESGAGSAPIGSRDWALLLIGFVILTIGGLFLRWKNIR